MAEFSYSISTEKEQRVILPSVSWQQYEGLLSTLEDYPGLRLLYLQGNLEIFLPSPEHEMLKKVIARLLERYAEEMNIPLHGYGSTTFRLEAKARGLEPDECYCVQSLKDLPDFALEVNLTSGGVDKLAIYQGLEVPEVLIWEDKKLQLFDLREGIEVVTRSQFFPELNFSLLAQFVRPQDQPTTVKDFLVAIRTQVQ
ncbi:Uma2 family endonuclease [Acaryochloris marina S15]|nr:Uma2 family endonuclease [Acaryochloris marina S15]